MRVILSVGNNIFYLIDPFSLYMVGIVSYGFRIGRYRGNNILRRPADHRLVSYRDIVWYSRQYRLGRLLADLLRP
jgi:hypothetical protein